MKQQKKWGAAYSWNNCGTITANSRSSVLKNAMEWKKHKPPNFNKILTKKQNSSNSWSNFWRWDFQIQKGQHSHWNERGGLKWWPVAKLQIYIDLFYCLCCVFVLFVLYLLNPVTIFIRKWNLWRSSHTTVDKYCQTNQTQRAFWFKVVSRWCDRCIVVSTHECEWILSE